MIIEHFADFHHYIWMIFDDYDAYRWSFIFDGFWWFMAGLRIFLQTIQFNHQVKKSSSELDTFTDP